jgi:SAM-dependent methyltransferase
LQPQWPPRNRQEVRTFYDWLFRSTARSPKPWAVTSGRSKKFIAYIQDKLPNGGKILDASCGRGFTARWLKKLGYHIDVTEVSPWLVENELKKEFDNCRCLGYEDLGQIPPKQYDAVISNDVLEHLFNDVAVNEALKSLANLSKQWLLISVGLNAAQACWDKRRFATHLIRHPSTWWAKQSSEVMDIQEQKQFGGSLYMFGVVKQ